uniref:TdIF1 C-terminal domain-containing protein n=2 Tax=Arion vulgaris TaxID=1028688 RepID=A0A0B7AKV5_9EUPU
MGARANKALGLGNMRGRLYIRHPDVFKYIGDQEDKMWLSEHNLMSAAGGKAYMLLLEDIQDLSRSDEYKNSPGLMMQECVGFMVPGWMLVKIKNQMNLLSSDSRRSLSPSMDVGELSDPKILPFLSFAECSVKEEVTASPENPNLLSGTDNDSTQPSSFMISGGFGDGVSQLQSDLDSLDHPQPDTRFIS